MAGLEISEESLSTLPQHGSISAAFRVTHVLEVSAVNGGLGGFVLTQHQLDVPYVKDYDAIDGEGPATWARRFDLFNWGLLVARKDGRRVGGAVVAHDSPGVTMLDGRKDLALLWDIRVSPEMRRTGVGSALFRAVESWAKARACRWLKVETQNINVSACHFYARRGCTLGAIHRFAYPDLPHETQLIWYQQLAKAV